MKFYAVIDTNVLVSALLRWNSIPGAVVKHALEGRIIPLWNDEIAAEYREVLRRRKFPFNTEDIELLLGGIKSRGVYTNPKKVDEELPDPKDVVFYAVTMETRQTHDAYLVTGNIKHFPERYFVVTPREMLDILEEADDG
ncbi:MAG: putative toxin-antitoxin system toxin component, PIN family [Atopobiaceae bacterium]|nr:putative toxin-antitoxin system toxin component, PIN family [Atopobiaceae bacterium]